MPLTTAEQNAITDLATARWTHLSLHTADPGSTGANEASGGTYARVALSWGAASAGDADAAEATVDVPAGAYTHYGIWSASTGGTFRGGDNLRNSGGTAITHTLGDAGQILVTVTADGLTS